MVKTWSNIRARACYCTSHGRLKNTHTQSESRNRSNVYKPQEAVSTISTFFFSQAEHGLTSTYSVVHC